MSNTVPVSQQQIEEISNRIVHIERMLGQLVEKIGDVTMSEEALAQRYKETYVYEEGEPEYGTDAWWAWADQQGMEDVKAGRHTTIRNTKELKAFFDHL
jgi:surface antigen